jgi:hypothetical protein
MNVEERRADLCYLPFLGVDLEQILTESAQNYVLFPEETIAQRIALGIYVFLQF